MYAIRSYYALPAPSHSTVISEAAVMTGAAVSSIVKVALVVLLFPQSSVAVKTTVVAPVTPHKSLKPSKSLLHLTDEQSSLAVAPPLLLNHASNADTLPEPSHSTVIFDAAVITGAVRNNFV